MDKLYFTEWVNYTGLLKIFLKHVQSSTTHKTSNLFRGGRTIRKRNSIRRFFITCTGDFYVEI